MAKGVIYCTSSKNVEYRTYHGQRAKRPSSGGNRMVSSRSDPSLISCKKLSFDETDGVISSYYNKKKVARSPSVKSIGGSSYRTKASEAFERMNPGCTLANFFFLRVLFWDMVVSGGDVVTDFLRGIDLIFDDTGRSTWQYGILTIAVIWIPGFVAAIHIMSMYRHHYTAPKTICAVVVTIFFYPVLPLLAYVRLLWRRQDASVASRSKLSSADKVARKKKGVPIPDDDNLAHLIAAIGGGIEAPIQFILQIWLIFTGVVSNPFEFGWFHKADMYGNEIWLPSLSACSLLFSSLSMIKTVIFLNIMRIHVEDIINCKTLRELIVVSLDHLPYFLLTAAFRLCSIILFLSYLNIWSLLPIGAFWITTLFIGYIRFRLDSIPLWLISFISLFLPVCFTVRNVPEGKHRIRMIDIQYYTFWWQNVSSSIIYILALMSIGILVNMNPSWAYDPNVILGNEEFNVFLITTIIKGVLSLAFAKNPSWLGLVKSMLKSQFCLSLKSIMTTSQESSDETPVAEENIEMRYNVEEEMDDVDGAWMPNSHRRLSIEKSVECEKCEKLSIYSTDEERLKMKCDEMSSDDVVLRKEKNVRFNERAWINSYQHSSSKNFHRDRESIKSWVETSTPRANKVASKNFKYEMPNDEYALQKQNDYPDGKYESLNDSGSENYFSKKSNNNGHCKIKIRTEWIIRIMIGMTCVVFVLAPIIIAGLFMNLGTNRSSYIYYTHENETTIIQAILINPNDIGTTNYVGKLISVMNCDRSDPSFTIRNSITSYQTDSSPRITGKILIIERDIWTDRTKCEEALKEKFENIEINGVVIIDHQRFCKGAWNNVFDYECFRPSYPTLDMTSYSFVKNVPILLTQRVDSRRVKRLESKVVGISRTNDMIPETKFKCDLNRDQASKCIPLEGIKGGEDITGHQFRTISCYWGNNTCNGFTNLKEQSDKCIDTNIRGYFCTNEYSLTWIPWRFGKRGDDRDIDGKYKLGTKREILEQSCTIEHCDGGNQSPSRWSKWINPDPNDDKAILWKQKLRYCFITDVCILEEKIDAI